MGDAWASVAARQRKPRAFELLAAVEGGAAGLQTTAEKAWLQGDCRLGHGRRKAGLRAWARSFLRSRRRWEAAKQKTVKSKRPHDRVMVVSG
ncbi:hypothetical protein M0R45_019556 [Rubus argutus]|uniref:Uncharacterized protein n=1 Tax=Rubus argutus TaxID=59490 RepID=A0AAW1X7I0_RUBAR